MNRIEWIEGLKKETAARAAVRELRKLLIEELRDWPPEVEWSDATQRERFSPLYDSAASRPSLVAQQEATQRVRWEFSRDYEAIEHYERNHVLRKRCPDSNDRLSSVFLHFYLLEAFSQLIETTENRVKRQDILDGLSDITSWFD